MTWALTQKTSFRRAGGLHFRRDDFLTCHSTRVSILNGREQWNSVITTSLAIYAASAAAALAVKDNLPLQRRKDLIDPALSIDKAAFE